MAQKVTRKQLLKEPDEFLTFSQKMMGYILLHRVKFISGLAALFALLIIAGLVGYLSNRAENNAFAMLSQGVTRYNEVMKKDGPEKAYLAVEKDFLEMFDRYPGKKGTRMAGITFANMAFDAGKYEKALELYQKALKDFGDTPSLKNLILAGLGFASEGKEDYAAAIGYFERIASGLEPLMKSEAVFRLGLLYEKTGDKEKSMKSYEKLLADYPDSMYAELVREKVPGQAKEKS
ncbi:MAG: tol-pal system YbgF family protein [Desulfococcaceae bacterium]